MNANEYYANKGATPATNAIHENGRGRIADNFSFIPEQLNNCQAISKKGSACKARPVKGTAFCVGHTKQMEVKVGDVIA